MDAVVTTLRTVALFAELPREVLARLVGEFDELEVPAGRTVFSQGDPGDALYIIVSGAGRCARSSRLRVCEQIRSSRLAPPFLSGFSHAESSDRGFFHELSQSKTKTPLPVVCVSKSR